MKHNNFKKLFEVFCAASLLSFAPFAKALAIYSEATQGDSWGGQLYSLENSNYFLGSQAWSDAVDGFRFIVPSGRQATITMNYSYENLQSGDQIAMEWELFKLPDNAGGCAPDQLSPYRCAGPATAEELAGFVSLTTFTANSVPNFGLPALPQSPLTEFVLSSGVYGFSDNYKFANSNAATNGVLIYSIEIEQTTVPLPSSIWFFASGVFLFFPITKRHKN